MPTRQFSRRGFLKLGAATGAAVLTAPQRVHAAGSDVVKIGLVGCGNRGRGSLLDSLTAMPNVRVVALGDLFREKAVLTRAAIAASEIGKERIDVPGWKMNCRRPATRWAAVPAFSARLSATCSTTRR